MCTLTIFPGVDKPGADPHTVVTMNRDEAENRLEAAPKQHPGNREQPAYWHGVDAATGGSWFGVNQVGLVVALLNRYQDDNPNARLSRGGIVPALLAGRSLAAAMATGRELPWPELAPCEVLLLHSHRLGLLRWNGRQLTVRQQTLGGPLLRTSSSLDYRRARAVRVAAFHRFRQHYPNPSADDLLVDLHGRADAGQPEFGLLMQRAGRHTKSLCQVALGPAGIRARYLPRAELAAGKLAGRPWQLTWPY